MDSLFDRIRREHQSEPLAIIEILIARGFLIEEENGRYYLSDNAAVDDIDYLSSGLVQYSIGRVVDEQKYITKRRRSWSMGGSYEYKTFAPRSVEIIIDENASEDDAIRFFHSTGRIGEEASDRLRSWVEFCIEDMAVKPPVRILEPYVSFYVKAISACGVYTWTSCDGNHKNGGMVYVRSEYPSNILHECIWQCVVQPRFGGIPYIGEAISFDQKTQDLVYLKLYDIASFLYRNRWRIREIKRHSVDEFDKKYRHTHSKKQIEERFRERFQHGLNGARFAD